MDIILSSVDVPSAVALVLILVVIFVSWQLSRIDRRNKRIKRERLYREAEARRPARISDGQHSPVEPLPKDVTWYVGFPLVEGFEATTDGIPKSDDRSSANAVRGRE